MRLPSLAVGDEAVEGVFAALEFEAHELTVAAFDHRHIFLDPDEESGWYIEEVIEGSTIGEVLAMTQWDKVELMRLLKTQVDSAIKTDRLKPNDAMRLLSDYERLLQEYTYLSLNGTRPPPQQGNWLPLG